MQIACVLPEVSWGISLTNLYLQDEFTFNPPVFEGGVATIPTGYGIGVEVNEELLRSTKINEASLF